MTTLAPVEALGLPTVRSGKDDRWISQSIGMIGPAGIGKSEFWSIGDKTLYVQTESGLNHLSVMKVAISSWDDWVTLLSKLTQANSKGQFPYDTIVIDTIDRFVALAEEEVIRRIRVRFPSKADDIHTLFDYPGSSKSGNPAWGWRVGLVQGSLSKLAALPACTVYIGHLHIKEIDLKTVKVSKETISIGGQLGASLVHWPDHFLNITSVKEQGVIHRVVRTLPVDTCDAKSRDCKVKNGWRWVNPKSTTLDDRMQAAKVNYNELRKLFT